MSRSQSRSGGARAGVPRAGRRAPVRPLVPPRQVPVSDEALREVEELVGEWLTVPQVAELLDLPLVRARQLVNERQLLAIRRGPNNALYVPAAFICDGQVVKGLTGTMSLLGDAGYDDVDAVRWLFTPDESLPGTPVAALAADRGTEVKRRAQASAF